MSFPGALFKYAGNMQTLPEMLFPGFVNFHLFSIVGCRDLEIQSGFPQYFVFKKKKKNKQTIGEYLNDL